VNGEIHSEEDFHNTVECLRHACHSAEGTDILIGSENVLSLEDQLRLVEEVGHPKLRLYFDTRNPFHIKGYDVAPMLERVYPHVCEVHLKDGVDGGNSTLLGKGNSGFLRSMEVLIQHRYAGWVILENDYRQIAADNGISPEAGIKSDIEFVQSIMA
jgi:sugar phosphate isomerase/epimerase